MTQASKLPAGSALRAHAAHTPPLARATKFVLAASEVLLQNQCTDGKGKEKETDSTIYFPTNQKQVLLRWGSYEALASTYRSQKGCGGIIYYNSKNKRKTGTCYKYS